MHNNIIKQISLIFFLLEDHQDISLKKRFSTTPKNALQNLKTGSLSKNLVSFDLPSSQRQSSLNSQTYNRKKGHLTRSVSLKHLKENPIPSFLLARYDALKNEAEICFEKLNIEKDVDGLIENCKEWVFEEMISKLLRRNVENVIEINKILKTHYCKRLKEFDHLYDYMIEENKDDVKEEFISLNDLLNSVKVFHFWKVESTDNKEEKQKVQKNLLKLINDRKRLDIDLTIPGFDISQIR